ncbi:hypothetical protein OPV22_006465 [Ensete ventricosum]|uniref:Strictosidine synthase conserved region domain-containing protein n=1 Tax=Ensete ventricosum TaxID=4639 RepID=A0AAV8RSP0_ENSVE|nr:hypothetical protein OPV22_006465 [Ensete ventricosum]
MGTKLCSTASLGLVLLSIMLALLLPFSSCHEEKAIDKLESVERLVLTTVAGPESLAFDRRGEGPYTGVSGGRILKWQGKGCGWTGFAVNAGNRKEWCDTSDVSLESMCGRPLGLQFHNATGVLYVADAYFGLLAVGPKGGAARRLAASADGGRFNFTNGVDVDQGTGEVYFTDSSTRYQRPDYILSVITGDSTGRLMKYDPRTRKVTVLRRGLPFPNGVALSGDGNFLLFAETGSCRVVKHWLRGPRTGAMEVFAELPGYPDNIRRTARGEYWIALNREKINLNGGGITEDEKATEGEAAAAAAEHPVAVRLSREGKVLEVLLDGGESTSVSEVAEENGAIWIGSVEMPYVEVYKL